MIFHTKTFNFTWACRALLPAVPIWTSCVNTALYHHPINHRDILYRWRPSSLSIMDHAELPMVTMQNHLSRLHDVLNLAMLQENRIEKLIRENWKWILVVWHFGCNVCYILLRYVATLWEWQQASSINFWSKGNFCG
jgi:hypothetical protein